MMRAVLLCALAWAGLAHAQAGSTTARDLRSSPAPGIVGPFVKPAGLKKYLPPSPEIAAPPPPPPVEASAPPSAAPEEAPAPAESPEPLSPEQKFREANRLLDEGKVPDAIVLYRELSDHPGAQCNLGSLYLTGRGLAKDPRTAAELYRKAAALGSINAQLNLGRMLERGVGVKRDLEQAVHMYREASAQGSPEADAALARLVKSGDIEIEDKAERARVLNRPLDELK